MLSVLPESSFWQKCMYYSDLMLFFEFSFVLINLKRINYNVLQNIFVTHIYDDF